MSLGAVSRQQRELALDCALALGCFALAVVLMASGGFGAEEENTRGLDALGVALALGTSVPLLARRRAIVPAFLVMFASYSAIAAVQFPVDVVAGPMIGLYTLAGASGRSVSRPLALFLGAGSYVAVWGAIATGHGVDRVLDVEGLVFGVIWAVVWMAGEQAQLRRERFAELEERADRAEQDVERERRLIAAEERSRIARDLHDSSGHAINVILVEAGAARLLRDRDPERAEQALETIEEVAREQIGEIDRLVQALRAEDPEGDVVEACGVPGDVPHGPAAGQALFDRMRASGLELDVVWRGERRRLGPTVGRASYRLLQEALTNVARHGAGAARVVVEFGRESVTFEVENDAPGDGPVREGNGLIGMRERVALLGGQLLVGRVRGKFLVHARLPYDKNFDPHDPDPDLEPVPEWTGSQNGAGERTAS
jgi:signal transduction histidine kinase